VADCSGATGNNAGQMPFRYFDRHQRKQRSGWSDTACLGAELAVKDLPQRSEFALIHLGFGKQMKASPLHDHKHIFCCVERANGERPFRSILAIDEFSLKTEVVKYVRNRCQYSRILRRRSGARPGNNNEHCEAHETGSYRTKRVSPQSGQHNADHGQRHNPVERRADLLPDDGPKQKASGQLHCDRQLFRI
jgi:hypothetical protein